MTPIETMARAVAQANGDDFDLVGHMRRDVNAPRQDDYLDMARAAIEAFPVSEAMIDAAQSELIDTRACERRRWVSDYQWRKDTVRIVFNAMKAAALEEGPRKQSPTNSARRNIAAVNACRGIPTSALEAGVVTELVTALEGAVEDLCDWLTWASEVHGCKKSFPETYDAIEIANEALARVKP